MKKLSFISLFALLFFVSAGVYAPATHAQTQVFDDGSSIQTFDDGSTLVTDSTGGTSATVANPPPGAQTSPVGATKTQTSPTGAQTTNITLVNPLGSNAECLAKKTCLSDFLNKILAFVIQIGTIVVIFMLVYVGYLFVVAQGEPAKITAARQALLWTVVGALILLGSQAIAYGIQATVQALSVGK